MKAPLPARINGEKETKRLKGQNKILKMLKHRKCLNSITENVTKGTRRKVTTHTNKKLVIPWITTIIRRKMGYFLEKL